jgi:hypothetical protein
VQKRVQWEGLRCADYPVTCARSSRSGMVIVCWLVGSCSYPGFRWVLPFWGTGTSFQYLVTGTACWITRFADFFCSSSSENRCTAHAGAHFPNECASQRRSIHVEILRAGEAIAQFSNQYTHPTRKWQVHLTPGSSRRYRSPSDCSSVTSKSGRTTDARSNAAELHQLASQREL